MTPLLDPQACLASAWQVTPDLGLRAVTIAGLLGLCGWACTRRSFPGQKSFAALSLSMALWIVASLAEHSAVSVGCKATLALLGWPAILSQLPLWALFLYQYLYSEARRPPMKLRVLFFLPNLALIVTVLSNGSHGLFYGPFTALGPPIAGLPRLQYDYGPLFGVAVFLGYFWLSVAAVLTVRGWSQVAPGHRSQWTSFLVLMLIPTLANIAYLGFGVRLLGADPTSTAFATSVLGFAWMIWRQRLFDVVPLARRLLFTELPDPVLILDSDGRVVEANAAARRLGRAVPELGVQLAGWPRVGALLAAKLAGGDATRIALVDPYVVYDVRARPLGVGGRRIGTMVLLHDVTEHDRAHSAVVRTLAARDAELTEAAATHAFLREQAMRDPLTGLLNRRALDDRFAQEIEHSVQMGRPLALVLADLDHFKRINDTHGHVVGDTVLRDFGAVLCAGLRASDSVFRIGGEEFALLMPGADAAQASARVEALRERLAGERLGGLADAVTFSAGVASTDAHGMTLDALLAAADGALYQAKARGRDRCLIAEPIEA